MEFSIYKYLKKHPLQFKLIKVWVKLNLPIPGIMKRQLANEIHTEMIVRLMDSTINEGSLTLDRALQIHYELGKELGNQVNDFLSVNPKSATDLSRIIDFLHDLLNIKGKKVIINSEKEAISHWTKCSLYKQLYSNKNGHYYCHLYQEIYKGVLFSINPKAKANNLDKTRSQGCDYCELKTWIGDQRYN
ncbi:MAG: hypothetical protein HF978_12415 [Desulfobacteraceae bacterium]|nr:hypothetical protein [Desulfobacteraceae bacterium]MBC2756341.1 hypothetical protein [Desulfobacteraceae bacterium]